MTQTGTPPWAVPAPGALLRAAHIGPGLAVTAITGLLAVANRFPAATAATAVAAVLAGQLTVGWGNDLVDAARDRRVGRSDKPLATGELSERSVAVALALAAAATIGLSFALGWRSALVHLGLGVTSAQLYNLVLKSTAWSWLPYAVAFGSLPAVVTLAGDPPVLPPAWMAAAAAALGTGAHLLNALPDLADDEATGVRGLPHRLGARWARRVAAALLLAGSLATVLGPAGSPAWWTVPPLVLVVVLAAVAVTGGDRSGFRAAIGVALVDVCLLVAAAA